MFGPRVTTLALRIARAGAALRAFALLDDVAAPSAPPCSQEVAPTACPDVCATRGASVSDAAHPHRRAINRSGRARRSGSPPARPAVCLTPVRTRTPPVATLAHDADHSHY